MYEQLILAVITLLTVVGNGLIALRTKKDTKIINDAVNHRHKKVDAEGNIPKGLYDIALENHSKVHSISSQVGELVEWKDQYNGSKLKDAKAIEQLFERLECCERKHEKDDDE